MVLFRSTNDEVITRFTHPDYTVRNKATGRVFKRVLWVNKTQLLMGFLAKNPPMRFVKSSNPTPVEFVAPLGSVELVPDSRTILITF